MSTSPPESVHPRVRSIDRRANLRPLSSSEILDIGTQIYHQVALYILPRTFAPSLLCAAAIAFSTTFIQTNLLRTTSGASEAAQFAEATVALLLTLFVGGPLFIVGAANAAGQVVKVASDCMLGIEPDFKTADSTGAQAVGQLTGVMFAVILKSLWLPVCGVLLLAFSVFSDSWSRESSLAFAIPSLLGFAGVFASLFFVPMVIHRTALAPVIAVIEGLSGGKAISRAADLMKADKTKMSGASTTLMFAAISLLLYLSISLGVSTVFGLLNLGQVLSSLGPGPWAHTIITGLVKAFPFWLALWIILPYWGCVITTLYYDRRVKLEGFDIQTLAEDIKHADRQTALLN